MSTTTNLRRGQHVRVRLGAARHLATVRQVVSGRVLVEFAHPVPHPSIAGECMRWYWSDPRALEVGG